MAQHPYMLQPTAPPQQVYAAPVYGVPVTEAPMMAPPPQQAMSLLDCYATLPGVLVKQVTTAAAVMSAALDLPFEPAQQFMVHAMPQGTHAAREHNAPGNWNPSLAEIERLPQVAFVQEESDCCLRVLLSIVGGLNLRALKLHFLRGGVEEMTNTRTCAMGAMCCCPLTMYVSQADRLLGAVLEDSSCGGCFEECCLCTYTHKVMVAQPGGGLDHRYSIVVPTCCCGRVNNCCGATCCKPNLIMDIVTPDGKLVSTVQKTYGGGQGCESCARMTVQLDNYLIEFPVDATPTERALIVNGVLSAEYAYFSRTGGDSDSSS